MRLNYEAGLWLPLFQSLRAAPLIGGIEQTLNRTEQNREELEWVHSTVHTLQCSAVNTRHPPAPLLHLSGKTSFFSSFLQSFLSKVRCSGSQFSFGGAVSMFVGPKLFLKRLVPVFDTELATVDRVAFRWNHKSCRTFTRSKFFCNSRKRII